MAVGRVQRAAAAASDGRGRPGGGTRGGDRAPGRGPGEPATRSRPTDGSRCRARAGCSRTATRAGSRPRGDGTALGIIYAMHAAGELDEVLACEARPLLQGGAAHGLGARPGGCAVSADRRRGGGRRDGRGAWSTRSSSAATGWPRTATPPTRSAPTTSRSSRATTASRSGSPGRTPRSTSTRRTARPSWSRSGTPPRSARRPGHRIAPADAPAWNPAFDVTPAELITGLRSPTSGSCGRRSAAESVAAASARRPRSAGGAGPMTELETRRLLVELLGAFYARGWVSGTGGGICGPADGGNLLLAPTGVHKERVQPDEFFVVDPADGRVVRSPEKAGLRPSECGSIFCLAVRERAAGSVVHSHALSAVLFGDLADGATTSPSRDLEMLKGIRGLGNRDVHLRAGHPQHASASPSSSSSSTAVLADPRFAPVLRRRRRRPRRLHLGRGRVGGQASRGGLPLPVRGHRSAARSPQGGSHDDRDHDHGSEGHYLCPTCQQHIPHAKIDVVDVAAAVAGRQADRGGRLQAHLHRPRHAVERLRVPGPPGAVPDPRPHDPRRDRLRPRGHRRGPRRRRHAARSRRATSGSSRPTPPTAAASRTRPRCSSSRRPSTIRTTRTGSGSTTDGRPAARSSRSRRGRSRPYVLTVGDPDRAAAIGERLDGGRQARPLPRVPHVAGRLEGPRPDGHLARRRWRRGRRRVRGAHPRRREGHHPTRHVRVVPARGPLGRPAHRHRRGPRGRRLASSCCR